MYTTKIVYTLNHLLLSQSPQAPLSSPLHTPVPYFPSQDDASNFIPNYLTPTVTYNQTPFKNCVFHLQKPSYPTNTLNHSLPPNQTPPLTPPPPLTPTPTPLSCYNTVIIAYLCQNPLFLLFDLVLHFLVKFLNFLVVCCVLTKIGQKNKMLVDIEPAN